MRYPTYDQGVLLSMTSIFGVSLHSLCESVTSHAPSWSLVPPILIGCASLIGAILSAWKVREDVAAGRERRSEEREIHSFRIAREKVLTPERLDTRP